MAQKRVLVVEDDMALRQLLAGVLAEEAFAVVVAADGREALARIQEERFDAILLDLRLPEMDGWTFARAYHALPGPHAPLLLVSARPPAELAGTAQALGAAGYLAKPYDLEELVDLVRHATGLAPHTVAVMPSTPTAPSTPVTRSTRVLPSAPCTPARPMVPATTDVDEDSGEAEATETPRRVDQRLAGRLPRVASPARAARRVATAAKGGLERRRHMQRLGAEVSRLRAALARVQMETRALLEPERTRPLDEAEARRVRALRQESERLHWELQSLWDEFRQAR